MFTRARLLIFLFAALPSLLFARTNATHRVQALAELSYSELIDKAVEYNNTQYIDSALFVYNYLAEQYSDNLSTDDVRHTVTAIARVGDIYRSRFANYPRAYSYLTRALHLSKQHNLSDVHAFSSASLALLYEIEANSNDHHELADTVISLLRESFNIAYESKLWKQMLDASYNMAICAYSKGKMHDVANELKIVSEAHFPKGIAGVDYTRSFCNGMQAMSENDYDKAASCFEQMRKFAVNPDQISSYYANIAEVYYQTNRIPEAIKAMDHIYETAKAEKNNYFLMQIYGEYYSYYQKLGDTKTAERYRLEYLEKKIEVLNRDKIQQVSDMRFLTQIDSINVSMSQLTRSHREQRNMLISISVVAAIITLLLLILLNAYRQLNRRNEALYQRHRESLQNEQNERMHRQKLLEILHEKESQEQVLEKASDAENRQKLNSLSEERQEEILAKVGQAMTDTSLICEEKFSIQDLAEAIGERQRDVSEIINTKYGVNFHSLLGDYRIKEACRRINEQPEYDNMTIEAIAASVGIKSRSHFALMFKRTTGLNPSEYIRIARTQRDAQ